VPKAVSAPAAKSPREPMSPLEETSGNWENIGKKAEKSDHSSVFMLNIAFFCVLDVFDVVQAWVYYITY
jgi:hypothetical protein